MKAFCFQQDEFIRLPGNRFCKTPGAEAKLAWESKYPFNQ
jgi:hypothetical protein